MADEHVTTDADKLAQPTDNSPKKPE
jgi:hypothetical protein